MAMAVTPMPSPSASAVVFEAAISGLFLPTRGRSSRIRVKISEPFIADDPSRRKNFCEGFRRCIALKVSVLGKPLIATLCTEAFLWTVPS